MRKDFSTLFKHMAFGVDSGISKTENNSVQTADKIDNVGTIEESTSYGGTKEITEEVYADADTFTNEAVNGQNGTSIVTSHNLTQSNTDYAKASKTTRTALAAPVSG